MTFRRSSRDSMIAAIIAVTQAKTRFRNMAGRPFTVRPPTSAPVPAASLQKHRETQVDQPSSGRFG